MYIHFGVGVMDPKDLRILEKFTIKLNTDRGFFKYFKVQHSTLCSKFLNIIIGVESACDRY